MIINTHNHKRTPKSRHALQYHRKVLTLEPVPASVVVSAFKLGAAHPNEGWWF